MKLTAAKNGGGSGGAAAKQPGWWNGRRRRVSLCLAVCVVLAGAGSARAETWSVMQFEDKIREWKAGQKLPPPLTYTVEGRVSLYSREPLRLLRCDVPFLSKHETPGFSGKSAYGEGTSKIVCSS